MALSFIRGATATREHGVGADVCVFDAAATNWCYGDLDLGTDTFTIDGDSDGDDGWLPDTALMKTEVHSTMKEGRPNSPLLRALLWLCGNNTDDDRPPSHGKVNID
jgi:hypothetical protein